MASEPTETSPAQVASFEYQQAHINDDLRPVLYAVPWALWSLAAIAVCLRFCGKRLVQSPFLLEDVLILVGLVRHAKPWENQQELMVFCSWLGQDKPPVGVLVSRLSHLLKPTFTHNDRSGIWIWAPLDITTSSYD